jgi:RIO kinase 1
VEMTEAVVSESLHNVDGNFAYTDDLASDGFAEAHRQDDSPFLRASKDDEACHGEPVAADFSDPYDDDNDEPDYDAYNTSSGFSGKKTSSMSHDVVNNMNRVQRLEISNARGIIMQGRDDRATMEQVMDPRTRLILFKLLNSGFLSSINGCVSTGKEANVYYATPGAKSKTTSNAFAVKIYKTSILVFKDRDKYVSGEYRYRSGYCKSNPRKMIQVWAEKEMRNYKRIYAAGISCPQPILLKSPNVFIMEFLGGATDSGKSCDDEVDWQPSPRLKDADLSEKRYREAYVQACLILRHLYHRCNLIHGDYSEYNLLWHNDQLYVIDVSQSVELSHPSAHDFLKRDILAINTFFHKVAKLSTMTTQQLYEFIVTAGPSESPDQESDFEWELLSSIMQQIEGKLHSKSLCTDGLQQPLAEDPLHQEASTATVEQQEAMNEAVFINTFIPQTLDQLDPYNIEQYTAGNVEQAYAQAVSTMLSVQPSSRAVSWQVDESNRVTGERMGDDQSSSSGSDDDDDGSEGDEDDESQRAHRRVPKTSEELEAEREARKAFRKENKKLVKEANKEARKEKLKKKEKKRAIKKAKAGNKSTAKK